MFDDPQKELKRLEEELLAAENKDDEFERLYEELYDEFGEEPQNDEDFLQEQVEPQRNYSNGYGTKPQNVPEKTRKVREEDYVDADRYAAPAKSKKQSNRGLVILACLESLGIVAVVLWWVLRIL